MSAPGAHGAARLLSPSAAALTFAIGMWTVVAQTIVFRAFFETFEGSEFGVAAFFASWLTWVAVGAVAGRAMSRLWRSWTSVAAAALVQAPALALQIAVTLRARELAGVAPHELFPILRLLPMAWWINAPVSFVTGLTFTAACGAVGPADGRSAARIYRWDACGAAAGGLGATLALASGWTDERLAVSALALLAVAAAAAAGRGWRRAAPLAVATGAALTIAAGLDHRLSEARDRVVWSRLLPTTPLRGRFTTGQATYRFGEREGAWIVQSRETIVETVGTGDHAATAAALYLATVPTARRVLVAGPDTYALALAFANLPGIERVVWAPPDPEFALEWPRRLPPHLRMESGRLIALDRDLRAWLATTDDTFDIIALETGPPLTLADHRWLTIEFLQLVQRRLAEGGVAGLRFPGGAAYMGPEVSRFGAALAATAEAVFRHVMLQPGDESRWLMTDRLSGFASPLRLARLYAAIPGAERLAPPDVVTAMLSPERAETQLGRYAEWRRRVGDNDLRLTDARPISVTWALALGLRQAGYPRAAAWWTASLRPAALALIAAVIGAAVLCGAARRRGRDARRPVPLSEVALMVGSAGAAGMTGSLATMLAWQTYHGSLFLHVGALSALYMMGIGGGAAWGERIWRCEEPMSRRAPLWGTLALHLAVLSLLCVFSGRIPRPALAGAVAALGAFGGVYVPFAARRLAARAQEISTGAAIELFDHLGGTLGALATGLVVIPALGLGGWAWWAVALLAGLLPASLTAPAARRPCDTPADVVARRLGMAAAWALWVAAVFTVASRAARLSGRTDDLASAARDLLPGRELRAAEWTSPEGRRIRGYVAGSPDSPEAWCFSTADAAPPVQGYAGPIELAVALDREGALLGVRVLRARETPRYFARLQHWWDALRGWRIADPGAPAPVDTVSGATVSSRAVLELLREAGPRFAVAARLREAKELASQVRRRVPRETVALAVLAGAALVWRRARARRAARWLALAATAGVLGRWLNVQMSIAHVRAWLEWPWPPVGASLAWVLPFAVPLLVALVGNVYCGWLCPFGAVQELVTALRPRRWPAPPKSAWRWARWIKFAVLAAGVAVLLGAPDARLEDLDPLALAFSRDVSRATGAAVLAIIAVSYVLPRWWCRVLCPTGAWLAIVSALRPLELWWPRIQPGACEFGVRARTDLDCLACDRCRDEAAAPIRTPSSRAWHAALAVPTAVALAVLVVSLRHLGTGGEAGASAAEMSASGPAHRGGAVLGEDALRRIRERQRAGRLSEREAMYYSRLDASADTGGPSDTPHRHRWRGGRGPADGETEP